MKIALLQDDFPPHHSGGAGSIAYNLAREFQKKGDEILVITTTREKAREGVTRFDGFVVHTIATSYDLRFQAYVSLWNIFVARKVKKILRDFKPDVVNAHNVHGYLSYRTLMLAKRLGACVVLTCHDVMSFNYQKLTDFIDPNNLSIPSEFNYSVSAWHQLRVNRFRYNPLRNIIIRRILKNNVDHIVAVSDALKQALNDNGIGNVHTIHNGIDVGEWGEPAESIAAFKKAHGINDAAILFGGRLAGIKGAVKIIEALVVICKTAPKAQLLVVGQKDTYAKKMLDLAKTLGVSEKIIFTGWLSGQELHFAYHAASVVVVPSLCFDSFPTMNLEGMACHKPIVASCFGGSREAVVDNISGYIVNPFDVRVMSGKITELLMDREKNTMFNKKGYERVVEKFSLTQQIQEYQKFFSI